jgi:uncharacterized protein (TIGR00369 family)
MKTSDLLARLHEEMLRPPFNRWLAPEVLSVDEANQVVDLSLPFRPELGHHPLQPFFHGGVIAALADAAGHAAVAVFHGRPTPTVTLSIDYLAPATGSTLTARGILRRLGRTLSRADVELHCESKLVALARGTFSSKDMDA